MEWGLAGAQAITPGADVAVMVDVLRFTTAVTVAVDGGTAVYPYQWDDESAQEYAREHHATLAVGRLEAQEAGSTGSAVSLSPASLRSAAGLARIVLPSPNGSALAYALAGNGTPVIAAAFRNRAAVARWIARLAEGTVPADRAATIAVIAAGERWSDGSLRLAVEDLWGAGAVIAALSELGIGDQSPEAWAAEAAFRGVEETLAIELTDCASGQELAAKGFSDDVDIAAELDTSNSVPVLIRERFVNAG